MRRNKKSPQTLSQIQRREVVHGGGKIIPGDFHLKIAL